MSDQDSETMDGAARAPSTASAPAALRARYDVMGELGRGGMGVVYKARDRETGEIVALKVLKPEIAADESAMQRFKNELRLARKITHKNVCRIHEFSRAGDTAFISMECVEGESLRSILSRSEGLRVGKGIQIAQQICAGLHEAHAQGVVHRDLKPENILMARDGTVKVMDFGVARSLEGGMTQAGTLVGTPAYMSPEQAEGKPADARSDTYSLGLVLYEMFTGATAFKGDTPFAVALKQIHETPPLPREIEPSLPAYIEKVILKCLEKSAAKRFESVEELAAALTKQREAQPAAVEEAALPTHLTRWQPSDWLLVSAAVGGLLLFFPFFNRTSLAPRSQVSFDRSVLRRLAQDYAQRIGAPLSSDYRLGADPDFSGTYDYLAKKAGASAALDLTNNPVTYWQWYVEWHYNDRQPTEVFVDNRGSLTRFSRDFPAGSGIAKLSPEEAKPLAEKALADFYNRNASQLRLESAASGTFEGLPMTSFQWLDPRDYNGLLHRYRVRLVGREIAALSESYDPPAEFIFRYPVWQILPWAGALFLWLVLGLYQRRHVELAARWRAVSVAVAFVVGYWLSWRLSAHRDPIGEIVTSAVQGLAIAVFMFFALVAVERSIRRAAPAKISNFIRLFDRRAFSEPCGLAILRGTFLGLALLGVDAFLVWMGTRHLGMRLDSFQQINCQVWPFLGSPGASAHIVVDALAHSLGMMFTLGFFASLLSRLARPRWVAAFLAAVLTAVVVPAPLITMSAVQPYHGKLLLLLLDSLLLVWTFARFDLLTVGAAMFTFVFWWHNYRLLVMFEPAGNLEQWIAFAAYGAFVVTAAAITFKTSLQAAKRRFAGALE